MFLCLFVLLYDTGIKFDMILCKLHKKDPILHETTTFSLKQGKTRTNSVPIPNPLKQYTRHQAKPKTLSRLDFILVSSNFINNCISSKILPSVSSDHSVITCNFKDKNLRGHGYWKLNCRYLQYDSEFNEYVKGKIVEFKENHQGSLCNPNVIWDAFKCTIAGVCMEYSALKKKEWNADKIKLMDEINQIQIQIGSGTISLRFLRNLLLWKWSLIKILDFETNDFIIRSRCRWAEEGEKAPTIFVIWKKRSCDKKKNHRLKDASANIITDNSSLMKEIHQFYDRLYSDDDGQRNFGNFLDGIEFPKLSEVNKSTLDQPVSKSELYKTLVSMKHNKTPGFDGFPVEFFSVLWQDVFDMLIDS